MTESAIVNRWITQGRAEGQVSTKRSDLLQLLDLDARYANVASAEVRQLIEQQESLDLLHGWFRALARSSDYAEFLAHLRR